jgi:hypothetical protein
VIARGTVASGSPLRLRQLQYLDCWVTQVADLSPLAAFKWLRWADAHAVYDHLYDEDGAAEVGCWGHARSYVFQGGTGDAMVQPQRSFIL